MSLACTCTYTPLACHSSRVRTCTTCMYVHVCHSHVHVRTCMSLACHSHVHVHACHSHVPVMHATHVTMYVHAHACHSHVRTYVCTCADCSSCTSPSSSVLSTPVSATGPEGGELPSRYLKATPTLRHAFSSSPSLDQNAVSSTTTDTSVNSNSSRSGSRRHKRGVGMVWG